MASALKLYPAESPTLPLPPKNRPEKSKSARPSPLNPKNCRVVSLGRKSKLSYLLDENRTQYERMLAIIRSGAFIKTAALSIGITPETLSRWMARGKSDWESIYAQFRQAVLQAVALASIDVEIKVRESNPVFWLKCGPRQMLGDGMWREP